MAASSQAVAVVNEGGQIIGSKLRRDITAQDMYHAVLIVLVTSDRKLILSQLSDGRLCPTSTTLCRPDESADTAATRSLQSVARKPPTLHHLGDGGVEAENHRYYMSAFYGVTPATAAKNCIVMNAHELAEHFSKCTPALQTLWARYKDLLPV